jgi:chromosome segregation ATPase
MLRISQRTAVCAFLTVCVVQGAALAQTARTGGSASAQLMQQIQQLATERSALQAENDKLKSELADVKKDRDALKAAQEGLERRARDATTALAHSRNEHTGTDQELEQNKAKLQELVAKFRETIQKMREIEADDTKVKQTLATRDHEFAVCVDHNVALYQLDGEVLNRLERRGVWSRMAEAEPFTKIKRVELENDIDGYRERAAELKVQPAPAAAGAPAPAGAPAAPPVPPPAAPPPASSDHP